MTLLGGTDISFTLCNLFNSIRVITSNTLNTKDNQKIHEIEENITIIKSEMSITVIYHV